MTDKKDIAALQRPTRKNYDWSKAVWTDCDHCGEAHTGTVLEDDGAQICAGCCDAEHYSAWENLAERAIKLLEAERQRADVAEIAAKSYKNIAEAGAKEIAALKAKLTNPVVLGSSDVMSRNFAIKAINAAGFTVKGE